MPEAKTVAPRNELKPSPLYRNSKASQFAGLDPDFVYEWKTTDNQHPRSLDNTGQAMEHEHGNPVSGFVSVQGWEPVQKTTGGGKVKQADARTDQGKPIDTLIHHGRQIYCRIPKDEHAKYGIADAAYQAKIEDQIFTPDRMRDGNASMTAVVSRDENASQMQLLREAGHPIPGMS